MLHAYTMASNSQAYWHAISSADTSDGTVSHRERGQDTAERSMKFGSSNQHQQLPPDAHIYTSRRDVASMAN